MVHGNSLQFRVSRLPRWRNGKESTCQCRRRRRYGFSLWAGEDPLQEEIATLSRICTWKVPWAEEPGSLQFKELQRVRHPEHAHNGKTRLDEKNSKLKISTLQH